MRTGPIRRTRVQAGLLLVALLALQATSALAVPPATAPGAAAPGEIDQLIAQLGRSGCSFQRNGSWHDAAEAEKHLRRKYEWLRDRDRIVSAEQFIEDGASRSSMTGRAYQVRCPGQAVQPSARWMRDRLRDLRRPPAGR